MRKQYALILSLFYLACGQASPSSSDEAVIPNISYSLINARTDNGGQSYDIYLKDTSRIRLLNAYLIEKYNKDKTTWIQINYFNDSQVAKTYFVKQFDDKLAEKAKDKLFKSFIANYKYNPATKYDTLVFEH